MGLDIYLRHFENFKESKRKTDLYEKESERLWDCGGHKYEEITEEEKKSIRIDQETYALSIGLDKNGEDPTQTTIEIDSTKYPEHYFKIGYFRSSYNNSGINHILCNLGLMDLQELFGMNGDDYYFQPDWRASLSRVNETIEKYKSAFKLRVDFVSKINHEIKSEKQALDLAIKELSTDHSFDCYSNAYGFFSKEGIKIKAIIPGYHYGEGAFIVFENDDDSYYLQAIEIIKETIEWVLSKEDVANYYLAWSG
jgi:hypothetical protein